MDPKSDYVFGLTMLQWVRILSNEEWRTALGRRFEAAADEAFNVLRWAIAVGFARFLSLSAPSIWFDLIYWITSAMLFGYLASRFLLRPEIPIFTQFDRPWKRILQTAVNLAVCMLAFMVTMMALNHLVDGIARYRFSANAEL